MITKSDCLNLLFDLEEKGIDCTEKVQQLLASNSVDEEVLSFIHSNQPLVLQQFYDYLRKSYNQKRSKLYINIVKLTEEKDSVNADEIMCTLASLQLQALLFNKKLDNLENSFLQQVRFEEISTALSNYAKSNDIVAGLQLLEIIKSELKLLEHVNKMHNQE